MDILGKTPEDIVSLCSGDHGASSSTTTFASLGGGGTIKLWDTRLQRRDYATIPNPNKNAAVEASELKYIPDRRCAIALCGSTIQVYDLRRTFTLVAEYQHDTEWAALLKAPLPQSASTTLVIDEEGVIVSFDFNCGTIAHFVDPFVFGEKKKLEGKQGFGSLSNYCCGLQLIETAGSAMNGVGGGAAEADSSPHLLLALGMDGEGVLYSGVGEEKNTHRFSIPCISPGNETAPQLINPPLLNCVAVLHQKVAVGRADGMYSIFSVEENHTLVEEMGAPGHAHNGLCYVDWMTRDSLLTISLCGEVTGWNVGDFMAAEVTSEEEEPDLPEVLLAWAHREATHLPSSIVNCAERLTNDTYLIGDTSGYVTTCRLSG